MLRLFDGDVRLWNTGAVGPTVALQGSTAVPLYLALQVIFRFTPSSTMPSIDIAILSPSTTDVSTPFQITPPRSVARPLWNSATVAGAMPPAVWQVWQFVVSL